jgi:hypothetical protein
MKGFRLHATASIDGMLDGIGTPDLVIFHRNHSVLAKVGNMRLRQFLLCRSCAFRHIDWHVVIIGVG